MRRLRIALGDLSYLTEGNSGNLYVPLNLGYVAAYAKAKFGRDIDVRLFKDPAAMLDYVRHDRPDVIGLSAYYWQDQLNRLFVRKVRSETGYCPIVVMGGPSVDSDPAEREMFLRSRPGVDHLVVNEGEEEFAAIVGDVLGGACRTDRSEAIVHPERAGLKTDLDTLPSPYLDGTLDEFLPGSVGYNGEQPMMQTSRLCPYTCLAGDTLINTINGDLPIRELAEKHGEAGIPVYTFDPGTREAFISDSVMIRRYGQDQQLVRVHFDDGTHIDCTPDHRFLQISHGRQWECEAGNLLAGVSVRAMRIEVNQRYRRAYVSWARRSTRLRSRMVMDYMVGRQLSSSEHVHHIDRNALNDAPENLMLCASALDHVGHHPEVAERMRADNPTKNGMSQEWRDKIAASTRGKVRSPESRLCYRKSKLGTKNPNFKDGISSGRSRIAEVNHRVVRIEWLDEKGDVYCLTVPATGWFFANNVLVKNCSFCVSGKNIGKLRAFPMGQIEAELDYISRRFHDRPDTLLYLTDENFGILKRDVDIARMIRGFKDRAGYPRRVFYYTDKRFAQTSRDVQEVLGDACWHGVMLSLQSENPETLKAIKRRNLTDDDIRSAVAWAHGLGLTVSTELIFGLPHETRASFMVLLDKCARLGFDKIQAYNLIVFDGIEMNRRKYRDEHRIVTKRRPIASHAMVFDGDACEESEEVVVSSNSITFDDYRVIRAMNVMFHAVFVNGVRREFFRGLVASGASLTGFMSRFLAPTGFADADAAAHRWFLADLDREIRAEVDGGARQCVKIQPVFAKRLSDNEHGWAGAMIDRLADEVESEQEAAA